jgi:thiamine-monophosphate kinase
MATDGDRLALGIGDDAAVLAAAGPLVVSTDALIEGVHFRRAWTTPADLGRKALAVNLSDLAAMGARPLAALLALGVPPATPLADLKAFFLGLRAEGRAWNCPLVGGDLTRAPHWMATITVLGEPPARNRVFRRDGARPGDWLYLTGWPGRSGAAREGLERIQENLPPAAKASNSAFRTPHSAFKDVPPALIRAHHRPVPRLREAARLARLGIVRAAMDISDGLWEDAGKLAAASGVRLDLSRDALPVAPALKRFAAQQNRDPLDWILFGGEDYELLIASRRRLDLAREWPKGKGIAPLHPIGRVAKGHGVRLLDAAGNPIVVPDRTWSHF